MNKLRSHWVFCLLFFVGLDVLAGGRGGGG